MELLRLIAFDEDDLKIISAQLQDAIVRMDELAFLPKESRFVAVLKRFDWMRAGGNGASEGTFYERRICSWCISSRPNRPAALSI